MKQASLLSIFTLIVLLVTVGTAAAQPQNFVAPLSGSNEVPPVATKGTGVAKFKLDSSGAILSYKLIVANIDNVFAAHIHCAQKGSNGPVGVTLFFTPPPNLGSVNGILAQGTITAPDSGNGCIAAANWTTLAAVVADMQSGNAYVNVHTLPGTPSGEIRGQVR